MEQRRFGIPQLWKSWWLSRRIFNGSARISYSGAASIAELPLNETFDVALIGSILQHLENPFVILSHVARRSRTIVVTEHYIPRLDIPGRAFAEFLPHKSNDSVWDWWVMGPSLVERMMGILNFEKSSSYISTFRRWERRHENIEQDSFKDFHFYPRI